MRTLLPALGVVFALTPFLPAQVILEEGDPWHYFPGSEPPPADWTAPELDPVALGWPSGPSGLGYGDGDDATVIEGMSGAYITLYLRTDLEVPAVAAGAEWLLRVRYDDSFVAYLDGTEVARRGISGEPPAFDQTADANHEITSPTGFDETIPLPLAASILTAGDHVLAVEVHNGSLGSSDLSFSAEVEAVPFLVTSLDPGRGGLAGGEIVTVRGKGFDAADPPVVRFGGVASDSVEVVDPSTLRVRVPPAAEAGTVDVAVEDSRGTVVLPAAYRYAPPGVTGLEFDGDRFATAEVELDSGEEGTIEVWFQRNALDFIRRRTLLALESASGGGDALTIEVRSGQIRVRDLATPAESLTARAELGGGWHHLAFTFSPAGRAIWLDGAQIQADDIAPSLPASTRLRLGAGFGNSNPFVGRIQSARLWSTRREGRDISRFRRAEILEAPGLEAAWYLGAGAGQSIPSAGTGGGDLVLGSGPEPDDLDPAWVEIEDLPLLAITDVDPRRGPASGGTRVVIYGAGFLSDPPPEVRFGDLPATEVEVVASWRIEAVTPASEPFAAADITVRSPFGLSTRAGGFLYEPVGLHRAVQEGDTWDYVVPTSPPPADWTLPEFDAAAEGWSRGPTGIGYGDGDDATDLGEQAGSIVSVFARAEFTLDHAPDTVEAIRLRVRYDDSFAAWINGEEVARAGLLGQPPAWDEFAAELHEIGGGAGTFDTEIDISFARDFLRAGANVLAVEVHNANLSSSDLSLSAELDWVAAAEPPGATFVRGDTDGSGRLTVSDAVRILRFMFLGGEIDCREAADVDDDGRITVSDAVRVLSFLFRDGQRPPAPFPEPGPDLDDDRLDCAP